MEVCTGAAKACVMTPSTPVNGWRGFSPQHLATSFPSTISLAARDVSNGYHEQQQEPGKSQGRCSSDAKLVGGAATAPSRSATPDIYTTHGCSSANADLVRDERNSGAALAPLNTVSSQAACSSMAWMRSGAAPPEGGHAAKSVDCGNTQSGDAYIPRAAMDPHQNETTSTSVDSEHQSGSELIFPPTQDPAFLTPPHQFTSRGRNNPVASCAGSQSTNGEVPLSDTSVPCEVPASPPIPTFSTSAPSLDEVWLRYLDSEQEKHMLRKTLAEVQAKLHESEHESTCIKQDNDKMLQLVREAEQDRDHYRRKFTVMSNKVSELETDNAQLRQQAAEFEQQHRELEMERNLLSKKLEESRSKLEESVAHCETLRMQAKESEERVVQVETSRKNGRRQQEPRENGIMTSPTSRHHSMVATPCPSPIAVSSVYGASPLQTSLVLAPPHVKPRILITGATGLLGRQMMKACDDTWEVRGLGYSRARSPLIACDLAEGSAAALQIEEFKPHVVIHLAADRRQETGHRDPSRSERLNVEVTGLIAAACEQHGAWLIFLSTDRVFDGSNPPYQVDAEPNPLSDFGRSKARAEKNILEASARAAILRVSLLYGPVEWIAESSVTRLYTDLKNGVRKVDDWQLRYPTCTTDVASVLRAMVDLHCSGTSLWGIFHWQSNEQFTQFGMMRVVAEISGLDASGVTPIRATPLVPRPENCQLDCSRLEALLDGGQFRTSFKDGLRVCLESCLRGGATAVREFRSERGSPRRSLNEALKSCEVKGTDKSPENTEGAGIASGSFK